MRVNIFEQIISPLLARIFIRELVVRVGKNIKQPDRKQNGMRSSLVEEGLALKPEQYVNCNAIDYAREKALLDIILIE